MIKTIKTIEKFFDKDGLELTQSEILPDMSNVFSMTRTQNMTRQEYQQITEQASFQLPPQKPSEILTMYTMGIPHYEIFDKCSNAQHKKGDKKK